MGDLRNAKLLQLRSASAAYDASTGADLSGSAVDIQGAEGPIVVVLHSSYSNTSGNKNLVSIKTASGSGSDSDWTTVKSFTPIVSGSAASLLTQRIILPDAGELGRYIQWYTQNTGSYSFQISALVTGKHT